MAPRNRKKGGGRHKDDDKTDASSKKRKAAVKKPASPALWIWGSIIAALLAIGWLFIFAANLGSDAIRNDGIYHFLQSFVCEAGAGFCHASLVPHRRTQKAIRYIPAGEKVLVVPRHLQIWDLDALRDTFVQEELASARHVLTENPLDSGAFLAAYLARRVKLDGDDVLRPYFDILPTHKTLAAFHPALFPESRLASLLEKHSSSFLVAKGYKDMLLSEYKAFSTVSSKFASQVSREDYQAMRVHVMSRSFGPGPPTDKEAIPDGESLEKELQGYKTRMGVDLTKGCRAMVPVLDSYDHHASPNVHWKYNVEQQAFVVTAAPGGIPAGHEVMDSYGAYTDSHLYAKFGFVNGDGSGHTQASIAAFHRLLDIDMKQQFSYLSRVNKTPFEEKQKKLLARYFFFDDGYKDCVQKDLHPEAFELKRVKLEHLLRIANMPERWILRVRPRAPESVPAASSDVPITMEPPKFDLDSLKLDASKVIATCRLISLTNDDYSGDALQVLKTALENGKPITIEGQSEELEYRSLACLARLSGVNLYRFSQKEPELFEAVRDLTRTAFQSRQWTAAQVRLGEVQTLDVLSRLGMSGVMEMTKRIHERLNTTSFDVLPTVREKQCPPEYTMSLVE